MRRRSFAGGMVFGLGVVLVVVGALVLWGPKPSPVRPAPSCPISGPAGWYVLGGVRTWCGTTVPIRPPNREFREYEACVIAKPTALDCDQYLGGRP